MKKSIITLLNSIAVASLEKEQGKGLVRFEKLINKLNVYVANGGPIKASWLIALTEVNRKIKNASIEKNNKKIKKLLIEWQSIIDQIKKVE
jgi:hypothetical protein